MADMPTLENKAQAAFYLACAENNSELDGIRAVLDMVKQEQMNRPPRQSIEQWWVEREGQGK